MVRIFIQFILPLLLPTVLYFIAVPMLKSRAVKNGANAADLQFDTPWVRLIVAGFVLLLVGLAVAMMLTPPLPVAE